MSDEQADDLDQAEELGDDALDEVSGGADGGGQYEGSGGYPWR